MSVLGIDRPIPALLSQLWMRFGFRPWQQRRRIDVRHLSAHLRRDIGIDT